MFFCFLIFLVSIISNNPIDVWIELLWVISVGDHNLGTAVSVYSDIQLTDEEAKTLRGQEAYARGRAKSMTQIVKLLIQMCFHYSFQGDKVRKRK